MAPHFIRRKSSSKTKLLMRQQFEEEGTKCNQMWVSEMDGKIISA